MTTLQGFLFVIAAVTALANLFFAVYDHNGSAALGWFFAVVWMVIAQIAIVQLEAL